MKKYCLVSIIVIMLLLPFSSHANTFCVSDATELQGALTTATSNGEDDTIQIEQGTYVGNFIYASLETYSLTIEGGYTSGCGSRDVDPVNTVLDGNESGTVLVLSTPEIIANFEVSGLTLKNGVSTYDEGGGIYIKTRGDINITNNIITDNTSWGFGGGLFARHDGSHSITLTNNTITDNMGSGFGCGVYARTNGNGSIIIINNIITNNNHPSAGNGGGIYVWTALDTIIITNNTIVGNTVNGEGGGIMAKLEANDAVAYIINNIIWNNTAVGPGNDLNIDNDGNNDFFPNTINLYNNDFDQSASGIYIKSPFPIDPSNLDNENPLFVGGYNYHLTGLSPCIDTGRLEGAPADDMDGDSRPQGDGVDIGADEYKVAAIPTLTEWGMFIFMTVMMGIGVVVLRKRRMA